MIHKDQWQGLENLLQAICREFLNGRVDVDDFEIHATDIRNGSGIFRGIPVPERIAFRDKLLQAAIDSDAKVVFRSIEKKRFKKWIEDEFGRGVLINPHVVAFPLIAQVVNSYLQTQNTLGIFISDENKEIVADVEKSIRLLRGDSSTLKLDRIIEKGFFTLDLVMSKQLTEDLSLKFIGRNLINPKIEQTQKIRDLNTGVETNETVSSYRNGSLFSLTLKYAF